MEPGPSIDTRLLRGVRFACRPDCGLCCFARPAVSAAERPALLRIAPELRLPLGPDRYAYLPVQGAGGACFFLSGRRCRAYAHRPYPCRTYPVLTHLGGRAEATVVLGCPGVGLDFLDGWRADRAAGLPPPEGLDTELAAARAEGPPDSLAPLLDAVRRERDRLDRALRRRGHPRPIEAEAEELAERPIDPEQLAPRGTWEPPEEDDLEALPILFEEGEGLRALRSRPEGRYQYLRLDERGGPATPAGEYALPRSTGRLTGPARSLLAGYRRYLLAREPFRFACLFEVRANRRATPREQLEADLGEVLGEVVRRAAVHALATGAPSGELGREAIAAGIRATDAEVLDRPTLGRVL